MLTREKKVHLSPMGRHWYPISTNMTTQRTNRGTKTSTRKRTTSPNRT